MPLLLIFCAILHTERGERMRALKVVSYKEISFYKLIKHKSPELQFLKWTEADGFQEMTKLDAQVQEVLFLK